jgi:hypothetical protein
LIDGEHSLMILDEGLTFQVPTVSSELLIVPGFYRRKIQFACGSA